VPDDGGCFYFGRVWFSAMGAAVCGFSCCHDLVSVGAAEYGFGCWR
jgi:hypothetical protein